MSLYTKKTIKLEKLSFFGYHGVNDYEKIDGQNFKVDLEISFHLNTFDDDINKSIDYVDLYDYIKICIQHFFYTNSITSISNFFTHDWFNIFVYWYFGTIDIKSK